MRADVIRALTAVNDTTLIHSAACAATASQLLTARLGDRLGRWIKTYIVEPGVTDGSRFMELLAATVLAVPLAAGRALLLRMW